MLTRLTAIGVVVSASVLTIVAPGVAAADEAAPSTVEQLFVQTARDGTLRPVKGEQETYTLTLRGVAKRVTSFTDRPLRAASMLGVEEFIKYWDGGTFESDPPNAALVIDDAPEGRDTFVVELSDPATKGDTLTYRATLIRDEPTGRLTGFADQVDAKPPKKFGPASLFIDSLPSKLINITVSGVPAGTINGLVFGGFSSPIQSQITQGDVERVIASSDAAALQTTPGQQGTATVEFEARFCVAPGITEVPVKFWSGIPDGTTVQVFFDSSVQEFTGPGTMTIPSDYQLQGCP